MSGMVIGATPWTRAALATEDDLNPEAVAAVKLAIPDGYSIIIGCQRKPGQWSAHLRRVGSVGLGGEVARTHPYHTSVIAACWAVLEKAQVPA